MCILGSASVGPGKEITCPVRIGADGPGTGQGIYGGADGEGCRKQSQRNICHCLGKVSILVEGGEDEDLHFAGTGSKCCSILRLKVGANKGRKGGGREGER
jgi:hypothetical protein